MRYCLRRRMLRLLGFLLSLQLFFFILFPRRYSYLLTWAAERWLKKCDGPAHSPPASDAWFVFGRRLACEIRGRDYKGDLEKTKDRLRNLALARYPRNEGFSRDALWSRAC